MGKIMRRIELLALYPILYSLSYSNYQSQIRDICFRFKSTSNHRKPLSLYQKHLTLSKSLDKPETIGYYNITY